jgi:hypothetical protein
MFLSRVLMPWGNRLVTAEWPMRLSESKSDSTRWFKYDRDYSCVNKSQFFRVIFEPSCSFLFNAFRFPKQLCFFGTFTDITTLFPAGKSIIGKSIIRRQVWSIVAVILKGENRNTQRKTCSIVTSSIANLTRTDVESNPGLCLRSRPLTA